MISGPLNRQQQHSISRLTEAQKENKINRAFNLAFEERERKQLTRKSDLDFSGSAGIC